MGMMIFCSAAANSSGQIPCPSLPITTAAARRSACRRSTASADMAVANSGICASRQAAMACCLVMLTGWVRNTAPWRRGPSWGYTCRRSRPAARPEPPARPPCGESCRDCRGPECRPAEASPAGSCGLPLRQAAEEDRALRRVHQRDGLHHIPGYTDNAHGI